VAIRTCIACRTARPRHELLRLGLAQGDVHARLAADPQALPGLVDLGPARPGRGSYVCPRRTCLSRLLQSRGRSRGERAAGGAGGSQGTGPRPDLEPLVAQVARAVAARVDTRIQGARRAGQLHPMTGARPREELELVTTHPVVRQKIEHELALLAALAAASQAVPAKGGRPGPSGG
jgi:predicted RNA-binding protein YlxR (DUF448 family)